MVDKEIRKALVNIRDTVEVVLLELEDAGADTKSASYQRVQGILNGLTMSCQVADRVSKDAAERAEKVRDTVDYVNGFRR